MISVFCYKVPYSRDLFNTLWFIWFLRLRNASGCLEGPSQASALHCPVSVSRYPSRISTMCVMYLLCNLHRRDLATHCLNMCCGRMFRITEFCWSRSQYYLSMLISYYCLAVDTSSLYSSWPSHYRSCLYQTPTKAESCFVWNMVL